MSDVHAAVGSYVADALDGDERAEFEAHLAVCETCRREVAELSEATAQLSVLAQSPPPPEVRAGILSAIGTVRPLPPEADHSEADPSETERAPDHGTAPVTSATGSVDEVAVARQRRRTRWLGVLAAAALVIAVALGGWGYSLQQDRQAQVAQQQAEAELLSAPDVQVHAVTLADGSTGSYVLSPSQDRGLFTSSATSSAPQGHTYQVWTVHDGQPMGSGLFEGDGQIRIWIENVSGAEAAAITIEPAGGSQQPTTDEMAQTEL